MGVILRDYKKPILPPFPTQIHLFALLFLVVSICGFVTIKKLDIFSTSEGYVLGDYTQFKENTAIDNENFEDSQKTFLEKIIDFFNKK